jgi:hypothetical protein
MKKWMAASAVVALVTGAAVQAQTTFMWPAPAPASAGEGQRFYLPMGTPLMLRTRTQISTKDNKPGDRVYLEVAESVSFRGQVVIPIGSPVVGEVSMVQRNGHVGKKGKLEIRLIQAETPSGPVRLTGMAQDEGKSGTALSVGTMLLVSGLGGFLIHGTSASLPAGTPVQAYLAEDLKFRWFPQTEPAQAAARPAKPDMAQVDVRPGFTSLGTDGNRPGS